MPLCLGSDRIVQAYTPLTLAAATHEYICSFSTMISLRLIASWTSHPPVPPVLPCTCVCRHRDCHATQKGGRTWVRNSCIFPTPMYLYFDSEKWGVIKIRKCPKALHWRRIDGLKSSCCRPPPMIRNCVPEHNTRTNQVWKPQKIWNKIFKLTTHKLKPHLIWDFKISLLWPGSWLIWRRCRQYAEEFNKPATEEHSSHSFPESNLTAGYL